jgi:predicted nucleic acid-binding protein
MRIVDTSAWIEWLIGSPLAARIETRLPPQPEWIVPTIVQLELAKWLTRELGDDDADRVIAFSMQCRVVPLDTRIALRAVELHREHGLATADAIVYATARCEGAELLTCDRHFEPLPGVSLIGKGAGRRGRPGGGQ